MTDEFKGFLFGVLMGVILLGGILIGLGATPRDRECAIRFEYALTQADTLQVLQEHEWCEKVHTWEN